MERWFGVVERRHEAAGASQRGRYLILALAGTTAVASCQVSATVFLGGGSGVLARSDVKEPGPSVLGPEGGRQGWSGGARLRGSVPPFQSSSLLASLKVSSAVLGLAAAASVLGRVGRRRGVARHGHRPPAHWKDLYGGEGPPKQPEWLTNDENIAPWMTPGKWMSLKAYDRARPKQWYLMHFDREGNPAFDKDKEYTIDQALDILLGMLERVPPKNFVPSLECIMRMNLNAKYPDQQIRTSIVLPHGTGKSVKVAVFCPPEDEEEVQKLGAYKWGKLLADEIAEEKIDFDILLARPQMMPRLAKLGRILGPRKLMPSPKSGTVVQDYAAAIESFKKGSQVELRADTRSQVLCICGKVTFGKQKLAENFRAVLRELAANRPSGAKEEFWKTVYMKMSKTPGAIKISPEEFPKIKVRSSEED